MPDSLSEPEISPSRLIPTGTSVITPNRVKFVEDLAASESVLSGVGNGLSRFYPVKEIRAEHYRGPMLRIKAKADYENDYLEFEFRVTPHHICFATLTQEQWEATAPHPIFEVGITAFQKYDLITGAMTHVVYDGVSTIEVQGFDNAEIRARAVAASLGVAQISRTFSHFDDQMDDSYYPFRPASELQVGMLVVTAREFTLHYAFITAIEEESFDGLAYALDIPEVRNFAANGVLIHDSTFLV